MKRISSWKIFIFMIYFSVRAAIKITVPNRQELIDKLVSKRTPAEIEQYTDEIVRSCNIIEHTTEQLFETNNLTKLP